MNASDVIVQLSIATFPQVKSMIDLLERQLSVPAIALKPHECSPPRRVRNRMQRDRVPWLWTTVTQPIEEKMSACTRGRSKISSRRGGEYHTIQPQNVKSIELALGFWLSSFILEVYRIFFWNNFVNFVKLREGFSFRRRISIQTFLRRLILKKREFIPILEQYIISSNIAIF